jgi:hypothetical protein
LDCSSLIIHKEDFLHFCVHQSTSRTAASGDHYYVTPLEANSGRGVLEIMSEEELKPHQTAEHINVSDPQEDSETPAPSRKGMSEEELKPHQTAEHTNVSDPQESSETPAPSRKGDDTKDEPEQPTNPSDKVANRQKYVLSFENLTVHVPGATKNRQGIFTSCGTSSTRNEICCLPNSNYRGDER